MCCLLVFFFSSRRRHTRCALVTGVQTCALPICDIRFQIHPGSRLVKKAGRWIVAAELVETTRLYARCVARIDPVWLERAGAHLIRSNWSDPRWEKKAGPVVANERATLYGLPFYNGRRVPFRSEAGPVGKGWVKNW